MKTVLKTAMLSLALAVTFAGMASAQRANRAPQTSTNSDADYNALAPNGVFGAPSAQSRGIGSAFPNETDETGYGRGSENPMLGD